MKRILKILLAASALYMFAGGLFGPIYAIFVKEIGGDLLTAGSAYAAFAISAGIFILIISKFEDKVKRKELFIVGGYALSCIGFLGYLFIKTPIHLFLVQIIFGIGEAVNSPAWDSIYSKNLDKKKSAFEWGIWEALHWIVTAIAAAVGGFIANIYGFRILFVIMFAVSLIGVIISTLIISKRKFIIK